jgi:hypothetical protein
LPAHKEELLQRVFGLSRELGRVEFPLVVKLSTGYDVIPINVSDELDKKFLEILNGILRKFLKTSASTRQRYQGNRINEVGRRIEEIIVNEMNKLPLSVKRLGKTGYPDIEISYKDLISYLEMKTSSVREKSGFRYFYYTTMFISSAASSCCRTRGHNYGDWTYFTRTCSSSISCIRCIRTLC